MRKLSVPSGPLALVVVSFVAAGIWAAALRAQQAPAAQTAPAASQPDRQFPPLTFKVEVNYVEVDAVVTDQQGQFVGDLQPEDFEVFEDGKPQSVVNVRPRRRSCRVRRRTAVRRRSRSSPDVQTNAKPFDGRIYLIVLDDLHTERRRLTPRRAGVRQAARRAQMGANDVAAVVTTGGTTYAAQEFTGNKRLLSAAIDNFMGRGLRSATLNRVDDYNRMRSIAHGRRFGAAGHRGARARVLRQATRCRRSSSCPSFMAGVRGRRKALVFFSEGIDYDVLDVFNNPSASDVRDDTRDAIAAATRANVSVYSVDPRGLMDAAGDSMELTGVDVRRGPVLRLGIDGMQDELRMQQDSLRVLSDETGGFAAVNSNDYTTAFNRDPRREQPLLPARLLPDQRPARRPVPEDRGARRAAGRQVRARKGYVGAEEAEGARRRTRRPARTSRRPRCARRWTARCRCPASG